MPLFLSIHHAPGLSPEEVMQNAPDVLASKYATFKQFYTDLRAGFIVSLYDASDQKQLEREFERVGFPWTSINEITFEADAEQLRSLVSVARGTN
jgi:hypothetical protein